MWPSITWLPLCVHQREVNQRNEAWSVAHCLNKGTWYSCPFLDWCVNNCISQGPVASTWAVENYKAEFEMWTYHLLAIWPWTNRLISLSFKSFSPPEKGDKQYLVLVPLGLKKQHRIPCWLLVYCLSTSNSPFLPALWTGIWALPTVPLYLRAQHKAPSTAGAGGSVTVEGQQPPAPPLPPPKLPGPSGQAQSTPRSAASRAPSSDISVSRISSSFSPAAVLAPTAWAWAWGAGRGSAAPTFFRVLLTSY